MKSETGTSSLPAMDKGEPASHPLRPEGVPSIRLMPIRLSRKTRMGRV